jgi:hypothetical protein
MDAHTTANNNIRSHHTNALKLRVVKQPKLPHAAMRAPLNATLAS